MLDMLVSGLSNLDKQIFEMNAQISNSIQNKEYAKIIDTIPRTGKFGALSIAAEIGYVDLFLVEYIIFS